MCFILANKCFDKVCPIVFLVQPTFAESCLFLLYDASKHLESKTVSCLPNVIIHTCSKSKYLKMKFLPVLQANLKMIKLN